MDVKQHWDFYIYGSLHLTGGFNPTLRNPMALCELWLHII